MFRRKASPALLASFGVGLALALAQGCSSGANNDPPTDADAGELDAPVCMGMAAATCPTPAPSFATDIEPLIVRYCYACHGPGGQEVADHNFTTWRGVSSERLTIQFELEYCLMPLADAGVQPTLAEREMIMNWAIPCGAPNN